jgi:predicted permease
VRLLLTESLILAFAGGALGVLIAGWTINLVWATLPEVPRLAVELDGRVLFYTAAVCVIATLVFGLVPALHATRVDVAPLLKGDEAGRRHTVRGARVRTFFLVTQFATSMALLIVAGTFVRTLGATYVGEQSVLIDHVAVAYVESRAASAPARLAYWTRVREALATLPDFGSATLTQPEDNRRARLVPHGSEPVADRADVLVQRVDSSFFRTVGMGIVAGRDDLGESGGAVEKALLNERAARQFWRTTDVVGRRFSLGTGPSTAAALEISGVVRDDGAEARVFRRLTDDAVSSATILVRTSRPSATAVEPLRALLLRLTGDRAFMRVSTFRESATGSLQRITTLALIVAALVLALASVGLYGSVSFMTSQRTREVAIRQALGAPRQAVLRLLARDAVLVVAGGSVLGVALAAAGFQFMSGMIFARWTLDPITVAGVLLALAITTAGACYLPGRRAMRIDPMRVLRSD